MPPYTDNPNLNKYQSAMKMANASLILGIISLVLIVSGLSFATGSIGIILALLSKGYGKLETRAQAGLTLCIIATIISITILCFSIYLVFSGALDGLIQEIMNVYEGNTSYGLY